MRSITLSNRPQTDAPYLKRHWLLFAVVLMFGPATGCTALKPIGDVAHGSWQVVQTGGRVVSGTGRVIHGTGRAIQGTVNTAGRVIHLGQQVVDTPRRVIHTAHQATQTVRNVAEVGRIGVEITKPAERWSARYAAELTVAAASRVLQRE